jgi:predicted nucleotidyltransferase
LANRRSLNAELLEILDAVVAESTEDRSPSLVREPAAAPYAATPKTEAPSGTASVRPLSESVDRTALAAVCQRHHIDWLAVFGSFARGDALPNSDADVVVEFAPGKTPGFGLVRIADALRPIFGDRRVDLLTGRSLSPRLREPILSSAITLYAAE